MNRLEPVETPAFGLVAWLERTKITLPLKGVECRFEVTAGVASVEIDQIYHQSHAEPLDCTYTFPLPAGAAVYRCEMHVNGRVIRAKVEAREEARRIFVEQKAAGRRAAMVEMERENVFTLALGNLQPGDVVVIRLAFFQTLERIGAEQRLRVPVCPGIRYIPGKPLLRSLSGRGTADDTAQVPDASRISPPRIDALHPDAAYFCAEGWIARSDIAPGTLSSPTHPVLVHEAEGRVHLAMAEQGAVPDRDIVLRWTEPLDAALTPRAWTFADGAESYALVQLRAPANVEVARDSAQDFYFLIDRSGSMQGAKWIKTCQALTAFVMLLGEGDRVWITAFESAFEDFAETPLPPARVLADPCFRELAEYGVGGGTELLPAAEHVLAKIGEHSRERSASVILITDGQVGNDAAILQRFRRASGVAVHTFGIDTAVNDDFLKQLARQQGGGCWLQTPNDDIAATVAGLADRLRRPVLTALALGGGWEPAVSRLPDVHAGQVIDLCLRGAGLLEISGQLGDGTRHTFTLAPTATGNAAIKLLWARERIDELLAANQSDAALALAKQHNLLCEGAAFIAWDEAEQVQVAQREVYQPSLETYVSFCMSAESVITEACEYDEMLSDETAYGGDRHVDAFRMSEERYRSDIHRAKKLPPEFTAQLNDLFLELRALDVDPKVANGIVCWAESYSSISRDEKVRLVRELIAKLLPGDLPANVALCRQFIQQHISGKPEWRYVFTAVAEWEARLAV